MKFGSSKYNTRIIVADTAFLQILDYPIMIGNKQNLLTGPQDAIVTQSYARSKHQTQTYKKSIKI